MNFNILGWFYFNVHMQDILKFRIFNKFYFLGNILKYISSIDHNLYIHSKVIDIYGNGYKENASSIQLHNPNISKILICIVCMNRHILNNVNGYKNILLNTIYNYFNRKSYINLSILSINHKIMIVVSNNTQFDKYDR